MLFAVSVMNYASNDSVIEFVDASDWKSALMCYPAFIGDHSAYYEQWFAKMPDTLEEVKQFFFDSDMCIDVAQVPS